MSQKLIKPLLLHRIYIDSTAAYKNFFKNRYKVANFLELDVFNSIYGNRTRTKQVKRKLLKMARKMKFSYGLRLHYCLFYGLASKDPQILKLGKLLPHLRNLTLSFEAASTNMLATYAKWISFLKYLKELAFVFRKYISQNTFPAQMVDHIKKFIHTLKQKRLHSTRVLTEANYHDLLKPLFEFNNYPSTLRKLNFTWNGFGNVLSSLPPTESLLSNMKDLTALSIVLPVTTVFLQPVLASVPNASQISALELQVFQKTAGDIPDFSLLKHDLERFTQLRRVFLKFKTWPGRNEAYWHFLTVCPLIELCLDTSIEEDEDFIFVSQMAEKFTQLKSLKLKFKAFKPINFTENELFPIFFKHISHLNHLEQLKVYFIIFYPPSDNTKSLNFVSALGDCINHLPKLSELSIRFRQGTMTQEFGGLFNSLTKQASNLKKLRFNFAGQKIYREDFDNFVQAIQGMESLEVINLDELKLDNVHWFQELSDALLSLEYLKIIKLTGLSGELDINIFTGFVRKVLLKRNFRFFRCTESGLALKSIMDESGRIDLKWIVQENPRLRSVYVPFNIFLNNTEVPYLKWS